MSKRVRLKSNNVYCNCTVSCSFYECSYECECNFQTYQPNDRLGHSEVTLIKRIITDLNRLIGYFCRVNKMTSSCDAWFFLIHYCKRNFPMTRCVRLLADRLVGRSVGRSVFQNFLKEREFSLPCSYRRTCLCKTTSTVTYFFPGLHCRTIVQQ